MGFLLVKLVVGKMGAVVIIMDGVPVKEEVLHWTVYIDNIINIDIITVQRKIINES